MALTNFDPLLSGLGRFQAQKGTPSSAGSSPKEIAQGFESLLIRQFLAAARSGALESSEQQESGWLEMADDAMAGFLASQGGMGLANQVASLLDQGRHRSLQSAVSDKSKPLSSPLDVANESNAANPLGRFNISRDPAVDPLGAIDPRSRLVFKNDAVTTQRDNQK
jgi:Rod binding domain-containing protein